MKKRFMILAGAALAVVLLGMVVAMPAFADEPTPPGAYGHDRHGCGGSGREHGGMLDILAEVLDMTPEETFAELEAGKTIVEIAADQGVELSDLVDALIAPRAEALAQAVENGYLTQEQADWLLEYMREGLEWRLSNNLFGFGGFGMGRGHRGGGRSSGHGMKGHFGSFAPRSAPFGAPSSSSL
ncbi:MAG: hypothetical protein ISS50_03310 [Anaerolineae bacterium]|nr:hypothetical protein [Anaerolineae bacterium]